MAERDVKPSWWREFIQKIRMALSKLPLFKDLVMTDREIETLLARASRRMRARNGGNATLDVMWGGQPGQAGGTNAPANIREFLGGPRGASRMRDAEMRLQNLETARFAEGFNADPKKIWLATGWTKQKDGWKFELPDLKLKRTQTLPDGTTQERSFFDIKLTAGRLGDYVDAPELFEAYPELAEYDLLFANFGKNYAGYFDHVQKRIVVNLETNGAFQQADLAHRRANDDRLPEGDRDRAKMEYKILMGEAFREFNRVLIHETQHAIQYIEGFAPGANIEQFKKIDELKQKVADFRKKADASEKYRRYEEIGKVWDELKPGEQLTDEFEDELVSLGEDPEVKALEDERVAIIKEEGNNLDLAYVLKGENDTKYWESIIKRDETRAFNSYWNTAGEVEARNAERRSTMSAEDRKSRLPDETADVAPEDRIYLEEAMGGGTSASVVTEPDVLKELDRQEAEGEYLTLYRAVQVIDGKLYPTMAAKVNGQLVPPIELGKWEQSDEHPELADEDGYFKLDKANGSSIKARYNPYIHSSSSPLNDQFSSAYKRPNIVTIEVHVPKSELASGYHAEKAFDPVGMKKWKSGSVSKKIFGGDKRPVMLSRWDKPIRIVPDSEVAQKIKELIGDRDITIPANVVTPSLRQELEKIGVPMEEKKSLSAKENSPWGEVHPEYSGQGSRAVDALRKLGRGWIPALWSHKTIGDIALPYGMTDEDARKIGYKTGYGLAHIDERHPDLDWASVDKTISNGNIRQDGNRIILTDTDSAHKAIVQLTFDDQKGAWLVTAYKIDDESGTEPLANPLSTAHGVYGDADNVTPRDSANDNISPDSEMSSGDTGNTGNTDIPHGRLGDFVYYVGNLQMPPQVALQLAGWEYVSRSPYSQSYYNMPGKSWENTPEGVIRISDHWNFESRNEVHCTTDSPVENNSHWTVAQYRNGVYRVLSSVPKLAPDAAKAISSKIEAENEEAARTAYPKAFSSRQTDGGLGINHWARNKKTGKIIGRIVESGGNPKIYNIDTIDGRQIKVLRANVETVSASDLPSAQKYAVNTETNAVQKAETDENGRGRTDTDGGELRFSIDEYSESTQRDIIDLLRPFVGTVVEKEPEAYAAYLKRMGADVPPEDAIRFAVIAKYENTEARAKRKRKMRDDWLYENVPLWKWAVDYAGTQDFKVRLDHRNEDKNISGTFLIHQDGKANVPVIELEALAREVAREQGRDELDVEFFLMVRGAGFDKAAGRRRRAVPQARQPLKTNQPRTGRKKKEFHSGFFPDGARRGI
ncbi:MAG: hypothetical protein IJS01_09385 [Lentisphaeria bacterium]|nr:hypothetical protein [Lentisphaeria bacterium]